MQDWELEVSDPERIDEFLATYESGVLSEDERFVLMEVILHSFEVVAGSIHQMESWSRTLDHLERDIDLHISTVWYWARPCAKSEDERFPI